MMKLAVAFVESDEGEAGVALLELREAGDPEVVFEAPVMDGPAPVKLAALDDARRDRIARAVMELFLACTDTEAVAAEFVRVDGVAKSGATH